MFVPQEKKNPSSAAPRILNNGVLICPHYEKFHLQSKQFLVRVHGILLYPQGPGGPSHYPAFPRPYSLSCLLGDGDPASSSSLSSFWSAQMAQSWGLHFMNYGYFFLLGFSGFILTLGLWNPAESVSSIRTFVPHLGQAARTFVPGLLGLEVWGQTGASFVVGVRPELPPCRGRTQAEAEGRQRRPQTPAVHCALLTSAAWKLLPPATSVLTSDSSPHLSLGV